MAKGAVKGMSIKNWKPPKDICPDCVIGKQHRLPFQKSERRAITPLQLVHSDVCGPIMQTESIGVKRYFLLFIDDATRYTWFYFMAEKSEVITHFTNWKQLVENQLD